MAGYHFPFDGSESRFLYADALGLMAASLALPCDFLYAAPSRYGGVRSVCKVRSTQGVSAPDLILAVGREACH